MILCDTKAVLTTWVLKAAELHGATHQAVMEFRIVTDKRLPNIHVARSAITFHYRKNMAAASKGIEDRKTDTGRMNISSVELTLLDLVGYPHAAGGLDNIATIISDLADGIDAGKLATLSWHTNDPSDSVSATCWIASVSPRAPQPCTQHCHRVRRFPGLNSNSHRRLTRIYRQSGRNGMTGGM
jgi:hypothetical protein